MFMPNVDVFAEISIVEYRQNERDITLSNNFHCLFVFCPLELTELQAMFVICIIVWIFENKAHPFPYKPIHLQT